MREVKEGGFQYLEFPRELDPDHSLFFKKAWKNCTINFDTFDTFIMCLGVTILFLSALRSSRLETLSSNFSDAINESSNPPDRYILAIILIRCIANQQTTETDILSSVERVKGKGEYTIHSVRKILKKHLNKGLIRKRTGVYNKFTKVTDNRAKHYVYSEEHIKDWVLWNMRQFGLDRADLNDFSEGAWSTAENDWLFHYIGWQGTDPDQFDERIRGFIRDANQNY